MRPEQAEVTVSFEGSSTPLGVIEFPQVVVGGTLWFQDHYCRVDRLECGDDGQGWYRRVSLTALQVAKWQLRNL